ncbi:MAG: hypothetical protein Greene07147_158 [Parcubacteria group bacterium Greene0714_7]|nr:MAG: hypothetical protein Greene07147_158 [Parcubacteria group bacterium Greene0714_7]
MKCWGCNENKIPFFTWLAGDNLCRGCTQNITSPEVNKNYAENVALIHKKNVAQNEKVAKQAETIKEHGKNILSLIFGGIALLWFVVMLPAQLDFAGIVVGWVIIGVIYLAFKRFSR